MKDYNKVESCLKSFLKNNKRLSYSMALLITFLINGGFSYADEAVQVPLRTEIKTRIEKEQENISQMLKEADESMKDIELKIKKLTQRGEFWVKPLEKSYQGFIFANWGNYSKNKNKTESNFNGPEYSASYGSSMGYGQFSNGKYYGEYGIVKNPLEFVDKIDFGANITAKEVTEKTIAEKTVVKKDITAPVVTPPTIEVGTITLTAPEEVKVNDGDVPNDPTVNIQVPGTVPTLGGITVAAVSEVNVNPSTPTVGEAPKINAPTVAPPATPAGFTPAIIPLPKPPKDPDKPDISVFNPIDLAFQGTGFGQGYSPSMSKNSMTLQNFDTYNTNSKVYISTGASGTTWSGGNVTVTNGGSTQVLTPGSYSGEYITFISDAANHSVTINGDYDMTRTDTSGKGTVYFVSLNPYQVSIGSTSSNTETYNFAGNLTLHGFEDATSSKLLLGFEHQLLAGGGGGGDPFGSGTSIFKNSGTINLASGTNLVGIQIDTEGTQFRTQAQTRNDGIINVSSKNGYLSNSVDKKV